MKVDTAVGILSYGCSLPGYCITAETIGQAHGSNGQVGRQLGVDQKTVAAIDEDTITLATMAGYQALQNWSALTEDPATSPHKDNVQAVFVGSESHPYAVKPSGTIIKTALGLGEQTALADLQFACKAGTQALQITLNYALTGMAPVGLAIGADTAQSRPGDVLEYTAAAGAAAYLVGRPDLAGTPLLARCRGTLSVASDTPDFWRRPGQAYPEHAGRFSGAPGYFAHITQAATALMSELQLTPSQLDWCVFHTPNTKFPQQVAHQLGFTSAQLAPALVVSQIGNTYAAATPLALAAVLDQAQPGQLILAVSYGSGAGADAFVFETLPALTTFQAHHRPTLRQQLTQLQPLTYLEYLATQEGKH